MSFDSGLAWVMFGASGLVAFLLIAFAVIRAIINHAFAFSGHKFYVAATGKQPQCPDCPMNKRCPYSNGTVCHFSQKRIKL